jgi:hypothetical protein
MKQNNETTQAIRNMEPEWVKACGRNFALTSRTTVQLNGGTRKEKKIIGEEDNERREMYV